MSVKSEVLLTTHNFTLIYDGPAEWTTEFEDAIFEAGCSDALLGSRDGITYLVFEREAPSFEEALLSAIADVRKSSTGLTLIQVEPA